MWLPTTDCHKYRNLVFLIAVYSFSLATIGCRSSRISGVYVAHGPASANMLQLTQTDNGQISGVLSNVELNAEGKLSSEQALVTGVIDADQLTLTVHSTLSFLPGTTLAGAVNGKTIKIQVVQEKGNVSSWTFVRSPPSEFKTYSDQVKMQAKGIQLSTNLVQGVKQLRQTVHDSEEWISNAELHAQRIPVVKVEYRKIEDDMRALIARERTISNPAARGQVSVQVSQRDVMGIQFDVQLNQMWDQIIGDSGQNLSRAFASYPPSCYTSVELQKHGANPSVIAAWNDACPQALAERAKFSAVFARMMQMRADLKFFQVTAQAHRKALVEEASRIQ